ncbi:hypothetical protein CVT25_007758 [Psilocybe cyanescens]|uniref:Ricin B lectin domain-containing protein n=1 Tax=Psilocybe cyanescens TaxID=93625 RepID=A0A409XHX9_PSICY|nr:hypothetical protein CVT25_007758 [Psilocybe cyanescens]
MPANIQNGTRYILVNKKGKTVVDLSGTDSRSVIGWDRHGGTNQQWEAIQTHGGWHLKNAGTGKYLSLGARPENGGSVVGSDEPFIWELVEDSEDQNGIRVKVPNTNKDLDLSDHGNPTAGNPIAIWGSWKGENQVWYFEQARYVIVNKKAGTVIDLSGTDIGNYQVIGWERHSGTNQQWKTIEVNGGWHIKNVGNGKYLSLGGASAQDGVSVVGSDDHFIWELVRDSEDKNAIRIKIPHSNQNVDLSDHGNPTPGTHIVVWGQWEGQNQVWYFEQSKPR